MYDDPEHKDKFGVSWQVVPFVLLEMLSDSDYEKSQRTMEAMLRMKSSILPSLSGRMPDREFYAI